MRKKINYKHYFLLTTKENVAEVIYKHRKLHTSHEGITNPHARYLYISTWHKFYLLARDQSRHAF